MKDNVVNYLVEQYGNDKTNLLLAYMKHILIANENINLTAVKNESDFLEKHILDSLTCSQFKEFQSMNLILDMGTGAGFPGIPLAIVNPNKNFILVDSLNKRLRVVENIITELGINNVELIHSRAEDLGQNKKYRGKFDCCVSRAVASLDVLSEWCLPLVKVGGWFISYKGENAEAEIELARKSIDVLGGDVEKIKKPTELSTSISGHTLVFIRKNKATPNQYPRKAGLAKKDPIR